MADIRLLPDNFGVGFCSSEELPESVVAGYRLEKVGRFFNYHVTTDGYYWPYIKEDVAIQNFVVDGFSPNLNKKFHVGHLRNLLIAASLQHVLRQWYCMPLGDDQTKHTVRFVAMLGASMGVTSAGLADWQRWCDKVRYTPEVFYDIALPNDIVPTFKPPAGCKGIEVWKGPIGEVTVKRTDGKPLYSYHDLAFANLVGPTHYVTGAEQREHFLELGLGDRHLPMGLVMGTDGKKMKSRTGDSVKIDEILSMISDRVEPTEQREDVAWNIAVYNMLAPSRSTNLKFDPTKWTDPKSPGMYITYTFARLDSALTHDDDFDSLHEVEEPSCFPETELDAKLHFWSSYSSHAIEKTIESMDPSPLARYLYDLSTVLTSAYYTEQIKGGRPSFRFAMGRALSTMRNVMMLLSMKSIRRV